MSKSAENSQFEQHFSLCHLVIQTEKKWFPQFSCNSACTLNWPSTINTVSAASTAHLQRVYLFFVEPQKWFKFRMTMTTAHLLPMETNTHTHTTCECRRIFSAQLKKHFTIFCLLQGQGIISCTNPKALDTKIKTYQ